MERLLIELLNRQCSSHPPPAAIQTVDRLAGKVSNRKSPIRPYYNPANANRKGNSDPMLGMRVATEDWG
jgi:hypothetical protein